MRQKYRLVRRIIFFLLFGLLLISCHNGGGSGDPIDDGPQLAGAVIVSHDDLVAVVGNSATNSTYSKTVLAPHALKKDSQTLDVPYISQFESGPDGNNVNCGPASYLMLKAFHYHIDIAPNHDTAWSNLKNMIDWMGPQYPDNISNIDGYNPPRYGRDKYTGDYTDNKQMKQLLEKEGNFSVEYIKPTLEALRSELADGNPVLVVVSSQGGNNSIPGTMKQGSVQHWMLVVGIDEDYVYANDPGRTWLYETYAHKRSFTRKSFLDEWERVGKLPGNGGQAIGLRVTKKDKNFKVGIVEGSLSYCPSLIVGNAFSLILSAVDGTPPYTWSIAKGNLPPGISLSKDGVISGAPSQQGTYQFTVAVTDSSGDIAERDSAISVDNLSQPLPISISTSKILSVGKVGAYHYFRFSALGGSWPYSWKLSDGIVPTGLSLSASGEISGIPTNTGTYQFTVQVYDNNSQKAEKNFVLSVVDSITVSPTVAQTPMTAKQADTVSQWGTGFTPNSTAVLHFKKPDGSEFPTLSQSIKPDGTFSITYTIPSDRPAGTYTWWGADSSGKMSNIVNYTVIVNSEVIPAGISVSPSSGSWTSSPQNISVGSSGATTIYYRMVNTYDGSTPSDPDAPSPSSNDGSISGASGTFQLYASSDQHKRTKLRFIGCNSAGCGPASGSYSYSIDLRTVPGSVAVSPSSGSWTSSPQNISVGSSGATTIYYRMVNTYDGSAPSDPDAPSPSSNDGSISGASGTFQLYASSDQHKRTKLRFIGCNSAGCGPASGSYSYSIDLRTVPGSVAVSPSSGSWTSSPQNISVGSSGATTIYYTMVNTYDGSTPSTPSAPTPSSNDGSISGPSGTFQYYANPGQFKRTKLRFIGCNNMGCGSASGSYSYSIDRR